MRDTEQDTEILTAPERTFNPVVQDYLDFMLRSVTEPVRRPAPDPVIMKPVLPIPDIPPVIVQEVVVPTLSAPPAHVSAIDVSSPVESAQPAPSEPEWKSSAFSGLLFQVNGLRLVAPLTELGGITEMGELTPLFAQPAWFMGLQRWNGRSIRVVDPARLLMPERVPSDKAAGQPGDYQCVLMLHGSDWGLAIDGDAESIHLQQADVRWRRRSDTRPWLAGTVADRLCALLDIRALTKILNAGRQPEEPESIA